MLTDLKATIARSGHTMLQDLAGAATLILLLAIGLHLPVIT
ncbi:hypothetical protein [Candidatus Rhodobacter oscarellae]|nr:hypothetical protein [Candidatus Rhodobacter lobularis]